jgi:hypothetical protein
MYHYVSLVICIFTDIKNYTEVSELPNSYSSYHVQSSSEECIRIHTHTHAQPIASTYLQ